MPWVAIGGASVFGALPDGGAPAFGGLSDGGSSVFGGLPMAVPYILCRSGSCIPTARLL